MKLPLLIIATIDDQDTEFEHSVEVTEEEYDFLMRLDKAESGMHLPPWHFLYEHAPLLNERITEDCDNAVKAKFGKVYSNRWRGIHHEDPFPSFPIDSERTLHDLKIDWGCELMMVSVDGVTITDENVIGCHACRYYEYDTSPRDASGCYLEDCDTMDYDVFGREEVSVNERADHARSFNGGFYLKERTLTVDYYDENDQRRQVTQTWKYEGIGICVDKSRPDQSTAILAALRRSLRAISKKRLTAQKDELRNRAVKMG